MNFGIRGKLFTGFETVIGLLATIGLVGLWNAKELSLDSKSLYEDHLQAAVKLANAESALWKLRYGFPQFLVLGPADRAKIVAEEPKLYKEIQDNLKEYGAGNRTPEEKQVYQKWNEVFTKYIGARPRWFELQTAGKIQEAKEWRAATTTPFGAGSVKTLGQLIELQREVGFKKYKEAQARKEAAIKLLIVLLIFSLGFTLIIAVLTSRNVTRPILQICGVTEKIAQGDLREPVSLFVGVTG